MICDLAFIFGSVCFGLALLATLEIVVGVLIYGDEYVKER